MPSYIGHVACANELAKKLKLSEDEKMRFLIGNLIPDIKQVDIDYSLDEFINKKNIQRSKRVTHFRRKTNKILEFPNCDVFLEKYEREIKKHIETLAYFFHLCTDYYYFRIYLPKVITFMDSSFNVVTERDNFYYVRIKKNDEIVKAKSFFSKLSPRSLYKEYSRSDSYLIKRFKIDLNVDKLRAYVERHDYNCYVEEIDLTKIYDVFNRLDKIYDRLNDDKMLVFEESGLDHFVKDVVNTFIDNYGYLLDKYRN